NTLPAEFPVPKLTQATGTGTSVTLAPLNAQNGGTVSVEYTPMYTTDSIKVTMVGTAGAGSPVIPAKNGVTAGKVTFDITKAAIAANVGNANKTLTLKYDVTRSGKVVASKVLTVTVTPIPTTELAKTVIRINEADAATKVLDLSGSVTNKTLRVGSWPFIASFQPVAMLLSGFKADGSVHELQVWTLASNAVTAGWFSNGFYDQRVAASYFLELGHDTKLKLQFKATLSSSQAEADAIIFPIVEYTVNTLPAEFPVPKLTQASGTGTSVTLAPMNALNGATVSVEYTPMYTTDSIKVTMVGTAGAGSPVIPAKNGVATGKVTFDITKAAIAANIGGTANRTVTLDYEVTRNGKVVSSQVLTVTVTLIPVTVLDNTIVRINEADPQTKILDLSSGTANRTIRIGTWPFITSGQEVLLELRGVSGGIPLRFPIWNGGSSKVNPTWVSQGWWEVTLSYEAYLKRLDHNTNLQMMFSVLLTSGVDSALIHIPYTLYFIVKHATFYDLTTFNNYSMNGWSMSFGQSAEIKFLEGNYYLALGLKRDSTYRVRLDKYYSNLQPGRRYKFSFEVKRVSSNYIATVLVEDAQYNASYTNIGAWFVYIGSFTAGTQSSGKPIRVSLVFDTHDASLDSLQVDNIHLRLL
ncbi:hypothetical protein C7A13_08850, partial [Pseudomonas fluorescens]